LNERIKKLRKALDLTQKEFADRIGSTQNVLANYEAGRRNPSSSVINNICKTFNVSEAWLRTGEGEMFVQIPKDEVLEQQLRELLKNGSDSFRERLISLLLRLPPEHWETLEKYAWELIGSRSDPSADPLPSPQPQAPEPPQDLAKKVADLERQNQELAAEIAAMKKKAGASADTTSESVKAAEAAYEKSLGIARRKGSTALSTTDDMEDSEELGTA